MHDKHASDSEQQSQSFQYLMEVVSCLCEFYYLSLTLSLTHSLSQEGKKEENHIT